MLEAFLTSVVLEAGRYPRRQIKQQVSLTQQQHAAVGAEPATLEITDHLAVSKGLKLKLQRNTVRRHGVLLRTLCNVLTPLHILRIGDPMQSVVVRYPG